MQTEINDQDIKALIKITLRSNTSLTLTIPFSKNFNPQMPLQPQQPIFIPIFHTLKITNDLQKQYAEVNLEPLLQHMNHQHFLNIQTYKNLNQKGSRHTINIQFAHLVVWQDHSNDIQIAFKKIWLQGNPHVMQRLRPHIKVFSAAGTSWLSKEYNPDSSIKIQQSMNLVYSSLLDNITIQIWSGKQKIANLRMHVFQLLFNNARTFKMKGDLVEKASIKISTNPALPIILIQ